MGMDQEGTLAALKTIWREVVDPRIEVSKGRLVRRMGDGLLVEFGSVMEAVRCAIAIQDEMRTLPVEAPPERQIKFRIGITIGDVVSDGEAIYGDAVTIASRLESLAEPGGINVSRAVRDQIRDRLSVILKDLGEHEVANIARPVRVFRVAPDSSESAATPATSRRVVPPPERPAIAVLPFQNLGGDRDTEFFLDSVAEDLITELSRARWFSVIARNTAFTYKARATDAKLIASELGVHYVLEGSLRQAGSRARISCQLVEAATGQHLWAERFDGTLEDSFDLQDRITESVIGSVGPVLRATEIARVTKKPEAEQSIYDLTLRAMTPALAETAEDNAKALWLLDEVLEIEPDYPMANALSAWCHQQRHLMEWPGGQDDDRQVAKRLARVAISRGVDTPLALAVAGAVRAALTHDHELALAAADRATMICNNSALVLGFDALTRAICGAYQKAIEHAEKAMRLSPREPLNYHVALALALAHLLKGDNEEAVTHAQQAISGHPKFAFPHCALVLGLARLGRRQETEDAVGRLLAAVPRFRLGMLRKLRFADAARLQPDLKLLRAARLPE